MTTIDGFASARNMLAALREGQVSATELLELHLERIASYNPQLNAIVIPNEERARRRAAKADAAHVRGESLGPLHGLPLTIKITIVPLQFSLVYQVLLLWVYLLIVLVLWQLVTLIVFVP